MSREIAADAQGHVTAYLELMVSAGADLGPLSRISIALDRPADIADQIDACGFAHHRCTGTDCCESAGPPPEVMRVYARAGWVYALTEQDGSISYIGMTKGRLPDRIAQHVDDCWPPEGPPVAAPWCRARALGLCPVFVVAWSVGDAAARLEKALLLLMQPPMNTAGLL